METSTLITALIFTTIISLAVGAFAGKITEKLAKLEEKTNLTLLASLWATVEAKGLQRSTVIQRIIEKYMPINTMSQEARQNMEKEIQKLSGFDPEEFLTSKEDPFPFDEELKQDARDLV